MKYPRIGFLGVTVVALSMTQAVGQCKNGQCSVNSYANGSPSLNLPVEANVWATQELAPMEKKIVEMEKHALEKWYSGDPSAYISMMGDDIGYFEPILEKRLDGKVPLTEMYEALRGKVHANKFDMLNTRVQATENMAVLSCNILAIEDGVPFRWNCTEVFSLNKNGEWKLIHSHWSQTKPPRN